MEGRRERNYRVLTNLCVTITSSSRLEYLKVTLESLKNKLKFDGLIKYILHEDFLIPKESEKIIKWAEKNFDIVGFHNPACGLAQSVDWLLNTVDSEYILQVQDDWMFIRDLPIDMILKLMDCSNVNQVAFNKRVTRSYKYNWKKKQINIKGVNLVTNPYWTFIPAIWKLSYIKKFWKDPPNKSYAPWWINPIIKNIKSDKDIRDSKWVINNSGTYFLGKIRESPYVKHFGHFSTKPNCSTNIFQTIDELKDR